METPVGMRFHPTDQELCSHYLLNKNAGYDSLVDNGISVVNICAHEPEELPSLAKMNKDSGHVWYFFSLPDPKYPQSQTTIARNGSKRKIRENPIMKRNTEKGSWKPTGKDRVVKENREVIGTKKTLVFYLRGKGKGQRTNWVMHEYRATSISPIGRDYVVCKLKYKQDDNPCATSIQGGQSSHSFASNSVNLASSSNINPEVNNQMQVTSADSLNSFGRSDVKIIDAPYGLDIDLMLPGSAMEDDWHLIDPMTIHSGFSNEVQGQPDGYIIQNDHDSMLPESAMEDGWIDCMTIDSEFLNEPQAQRDGYIIQKSVPRTNYNCYSQLPSITGEYTDSGSDTDSETTEQLSFEEISSPIDSVCRSEGSNKYEVDMQKVDYPAEDSAVTDQFSGDTMTKYAYKAKEAAEPRKAIDQSKESSTKISSTSTQIMHACTEGSVVTETLYESQNKVTEGTQPRTMKLKSLLIHLLILIISIVGFKKLLTAKQIHSYNL